MIPLALKWANGFRFQRWRVQLQDSANLDPETIIGKLVLTCEEIRHKVKYTNREINVIYQRKSDVVLNTSLRHVHCGDSTYKVSSTRSSNGHLATASVWSEDEGCKSKFPSWSNQRDHYLSPRSYSSGAPSIDRVHENSNGDDRKKKKNKKNKNSDWLVYWQVDVSDAGDNLIKGESVECMQLAPINSKNRALVESPALPNSRLPIIGQTLPSYNSNIIDIDYESESCGTDDSQAGVPKKKSQTRPQEKLLDGSGFGKSGLNGSESNWRQSKSNFVEASGSVEAEEDARKKNTFVVAAKAPEHFFWPKSRHTITLDRGQALFIHTLLPKGNFKSENLRKQWTVNVISRMAKDGWQLWINSNKIVETETGWPHQEIKILPLTSSMVVEDGLYRIGAIRLQCDNEVKIIEVDLRIGADAPREELRWHGDYLRSLRNARTISSGMKFRSTYSQVKNRTTLYNPIGRVIDVAVYNSHDIEILLDDPCREAKSAGWDVHCRVLGGGEIEVLDHSVYPLLEEVLVERVLLRVTRTAKDFFGEITISFDGEDTKTRICPFAPYTADEQPDSEVGQQPRVNYGDVNLIGSITDKQKMKVANWANNQRLTIYPTEQIYIAVPNCAEFLDSQYKDVGTHSRWSVDLYEVPLDDATLMLLDEPLRQAIDADTPFYGNHGLFHPGIEPWVGREFVLPPLNTVQPFIEEILDALHQSGQGEQMFPLGSLTFSYEVNRKFVVSQTLYLDIAKHRFLTPRELANAKVLDNPADQSHWVVNNKQTVVVKLPFKWLGQTCMQNLKHWGCTSHPAWMSFMEQTEDLSRQEDQFYFVAHIPVEEDAVEGEFRFECGEGYLKRIGLKGIVEPEPIMGLS